ncbi:MAG: prephenate dehydrogenase/arogenate dehydrogenase family protein [Kiritimatiellaceae bacterium]|nr:prephenate dehydrogenase/arogenate dehydrogenase family protein [Kiritimatiellaceae bacterium]
MHIIAILGTGLMGSSLGLALKKRAVPVKIHAYARREETRIQALERGVADAVYADPAEAVRDADLVVFCFPVLTIPVLAKACLPGLKAGAILTDVGSTKVEIVRQMESVLAGVDALFIGSHPICGSEQQGIEAGDADLYEGAVTVVTPQRNSPPEAVESVARLWKDAGSITAVMSAEEHDRTLAATSHLPHVVASALALSAGNNGMFCGSGFRDTTRIADGSPQVWSDIVLTNAPALKESLKTFRAQLDELEKRIDQNDSERMAEWFALARDQRKALLG